MGVATIPNNDDNQVGDAELLQNSEAMAGSEGAFGRLLKFWRATFAMSQEELSEAVQVSARHISFLENDRSKPSLQTVGKIAKVFGLGRRDTNTLFVSAGFSPPRVSLDGDSRQMRWLRKSLTATLRSQDPFPSIVIDRYGNIEMVNRAWVYHYRNELGDFADELPLNTYRIYFSDRGWRPILAEWEEVACGLLMALQEEILLYPNDEALALLRELEKTEGVPADWARLAARGSRPNSFWSQHRRPDGSRQSYLSVTNTVGNTVFVSEPRLLIETTYTDDFVPRVTLEALDNSNLKHPLLFY